MVMQAAACSHQLLIPFTDQFKRPTNEAHMSDQDINSKHADKHRVALPTYTPTVAWQCNNNCKGSKPSSFIPHCLFHSRSHQPVSFFWVDGVDCAAHDLMRCCAAPQQQQQQLALFALALGCLLYYEFVSACCVVLES